MNGQSEEMRCLRCGAAMQFVRVTEWHPNNILLRQLQKIADGAGVKVWHCKSCGKVEFYKQPAEQK